MTNDNGHNDFIVVKLVLRKAKPLGFKRRRKNLKRAI